MGGEAEISFLVAYTSCHLVVLFSMTQSKLPRWVPLIAGHMQQNSCLLSASAPEIYGALYFFTHLSGWPSTYKTAITEHQRRNLESEFISKCIFHLSVLFCSYFFSGWWSNFQNIYCRLCSFCKMMCKAMIRIKYTFFIQCIYINLVIDYNIVYVRGFGVKLDVGQSRLNGLNWMKWIGKRSEWRLDEQLGLNERVKREEGKVVDVINRRKLFSLRRLCVVIIFCQICRSKMSSSQVSSIKSIKSNEDWQIVRTIWRWQFCHFVHLYIEMVLLNMSINSKSSNTASGSKPFSL